MRKVIAIFVALVSAITPAAASSSTWGIGAGQRIGHIHIGANAATELQFLGPASTGDGAAGHSWATWFGNAPPGQPRHELDIYTTLAQGTTGKIVAIVRVNSPFFRTAQGLRVGSTLNQIRAIYPHVQLIATFALHPGAPPTRLYDDVARGIAFEITPVRPGAHAPRRCTAISVHRRGHKPTQENMPMPQYLQTIASAHP